MEIRLFRRALVDCIRRGGDSALAGVSPSDAFRVTDED
jgi:hypothetical protein